MVSIHTHPALHSFHIFIHHSPSATVTMPKQTITRESLDLIDTLFKEELQSDQDEYKPEAKKAKRRASGELFLPLHQLI